MHVIVEVGEKGEGIDILHDAHQMVVHLISLRCTCMYFWTYTHFLLECLILELQLNVLTYFCDVKLKAFLRCSNTTLICTSWAGCSKSD